MKTSLLPSGALVARYWIGVELPADAEEAEAEAGHVKVKSLQDRPPTSHQMEFMGPLQNGLVRSFCKWVTGVINPVSGVYGALLQTRRGTSRGWFQFFFSYS